MREVRGDSPGEEREKREHRTQVTEREGSGWNC